MFEIKLLAMPTSTKPNVPDGPVTMKLSLLLVELKASVETVEFEITENTFCSAYGANAKLTIVLAALVVKLPSHLALIR